MVFLNNSSVVIFGNIKVSKSYFPTNSKCPDSQSSLSTFLSTSRSNNLKSGFRYLSDCPVSTHVIFEPRKSRNHIFQPIENVQISTVSFSNVNICNFRTIQGSKLHIPTRSKCPDLHLRRMRLLPTGTATPLNFASRICNVQILNSRHLQFSHKPRIGIAFSDEFKILRFYSRRTRFLTMLTFRNFE